MSVSVLMPTPSSSETTDLDDLHGTTSEFGAVENWRVDVDKVPLSIASGTTSPRTLNSAAAAATSDWLLFVLGDGANGWGGWLTMSASVVADNRVGAVIGFYAVEGPVSHRLFGPSQMLGVVLDEAFPHTPSAPCADPQGGKWSVDLLLVRRSDFIGIGGFSTDYESGYFGLDFCLRLNERRSVVVAPLHGNTAREPKAGTHGDRAIFVDRWAPL